MKKTIRFTLLILIITLVCFQIPAFADTRPTYLGTMDGDMELEYSLVEGNGMKFEILDTIPETLRLVEFEGEHLVVPNQIDFAILDVSNDDDWDDLIWHYNVKVTEIGDEACQGNKKLKSLVVGDNVWIVRRYSFQDCTKLKSVVFGSGLRHIGSSAFENCKSLTSVTLPSMVEKLYPKVFFGCKKLKTLTILTKKLKDSNVGDNAFSGIKANAKIYCHPSKVKDYQKLLVTKGVPKTAVFKKAK